jgi:hypothetical protein
LYVGQRCKLFASNFLDYETVAIPLAPQTCDRHSTHRKRDLDGISKA